MFNEHTKVIRQTIAISENVQKLIDCLRKDVQKGKTEIKRAFKSFTEEDVAR